MRIMANLVNYQLTFRMPTCVRAAISVPSVPTVQIFRMGFLKQYSPFSKSA
jgi:hypothetical protein